MTLSGGYTRKPYRNIYHGLRTTLSRLCLQHSHEGFVSILGYCCHGLPSHLQPYYSLPRLQTGWSVHTYQTEKQRRSQCLSPGELDIILQVIQRAERLDILEQQRIG